MTFMVGYPSIACVYNQFSEIIFALQAHEVRRVTQAVDLHEQTIHTVLIISCLRKRFLTEVILLMF